MVESLLRLHNNENLQSSPPGVCDICLINTLRGLGGRHATSHVRKGQCHIKWSQSAQRVSPVMTRQCHRRSNIVWSKFPPKHLNMFKAHLLEKKYYTQLGNSPSNLTWRCAKISVIYFDGFCHGKERILDFSRTWENSESRPVCFDLKENIQFPMYYFLN